MITTDHQLDALFRSALADRAEALASEATDEHEMLARLTGAFAGARSARRRAVQRFSLLAAAAVLIAVSLGAYALGIGPFRQVGSTPVPIPSWSPLETSAFTYRVPDPRTMTFVSPRGPSYHRFVIGDLGPYLQVGSAAASDSRGIVVASLETAHMRFGSEPIGNDPATIMTNIAAGGAVVEPTPTSLGGHGGLATTVKGTESDGVYPLGVYVPVAEEPIYFYLPSWIVVLDVDGSPWLIQIWGATDDVLAEWLPIAMQIVESIHFTEGR